MAYYHFTASRIPGNGNTVFPDEIIIDDDCLTYRKGQLVGYKKTKISLASIGCVSIKAGLVFSDVIIETKGGMVIRARGFTRSDASAISQLLY
jgi:hypothetical protein